MSKRMSSRDFLKIVDMLRQDGVPVKYSNPDSWIVYSTGYAVERRTLFF
jgi:hypothetical protein